MICFNYLTECTLKYSNYSLICLIINIITIKLLCTSITSNEVCYFLIIIFTQKPKGDSNIKHI